MCYRVTSKWGNQVPCCICTMQIGRRLGCVWQHSPTAPLRGQAAIGSGHPHQSPLAVTPSKKLQLIMGSHQVSNGVM